jgi:hypothetical protein
VIAAALMSATQQTAALGRTPLLGAPGTDAGAIAAALQQGMEKSGLFYESHVAEWAKGTRSAGRAGGRTAGARHGAALGPGHRPADQPAAERP